jgi:hypothetical protein
MFIKELFDLFPLKGEKPDQDKVVIKFELILFANESQNGLWLIALIRLIILNK